jgi:hypothetical protein
MKRNLRRGTLTPGVWGGLIFAFAITAQGGGHREQRPARTRWRAASKRNVKTEPEYERVEGTVVASSGTWRSA